MTRQPGRYAVPFPPVAPGHAGRAVPGLARCRRDLGRARPGPLDAHRHRHRRHRPALGDDAVVPRQHDDRLPRDQPEEALPAAARPRRAHHLEADQDRTGHRHVETRKGEVRPDAREAELHARVRGRDLERPRPHAEGRQGRRLRRPRRGPESRSARSTWPATCRSSASSARGRPAGPASASASRLSRCPWPRSRAR